MRIKEEIKRLGYFWLPFTPDKKVPGTLSISDAGHIMIEVIEEFGGNRIKSLFNAQNEGYAERIIGYVETDREHIKTDGRVTLDGCYFIGPHVQIQDPHSLLKFAVFADRIFIHAKYDEGEIPRFKNFIFSVEGIDEWSGISNFRMLERDEKDTTWSYQVPTNTPLNLNNGMQLFITFPHTYSSIENRISHKTYFTLSSPNALELDEFISVAEKIRDFLCFAINEMICFDSISVVSNNCKAHTGKPHLIDIYDSGCLYLQDEPKINRGMLFKFEKIQNNPELIINKWIEIYKDIRPALDLYLTAQTQQYLTQTFLNLMQGLEAYHKGVEAYQKRTSGKKPSKDMKLKNRLMCLSDPLKDHFDSESIRDEWMTDIKLARDQLTHEGKLKSIETYNRLNDFKICCLQLFQINLLQLIGFNQEDIDSIFAGSTPIRR